MDNASLRSLFTKPYGAPPPTREQWQNAYADDVHFQDPIQEQHGIDAFLAAQESLLKRCDDLCVTPGAVAVDPPAGFVEWTMGLRIKGIEITYTGATRLIFNDQGRIIDHHDYFDLVGPTVAQVPVIGACTRWLYKRLA